MAIIGIIAISENYAIGRGGEMPWHYSADLKFFKQTTMGNTVVMGSTTWRSLGKKLPNRLNIVLSRSAEIEPQPGVVICRSREEVLAITDYLKGDVYIIGGAKTYETFAADIEKWTVTKIPTVIDDADTFMPSNFLEEFDGEEKNQLESDVLVYTYIRRLSP